MNEENTKAVAQEEQGSIDFRKLFKDVLKHKWLYIIVMVVTFVVVAIFSLALPNYYTCTVKLAPELSGSKSTSGLAAMASSFGVSLPTNATEALYPTLYPELVNSVDFKTSLFPTMVTIEGKKKGEASRTMPYYDYLKDEQKKVWWKEALAAPGKLIAKLRSKDEEETQSDRIDPFRLTEKQAKIVEALNKKVVCDVDKKTMVITISVTDQDPVIAATMCDSVKCHLQEYITDYRTSKARVDLEYNRKICEEAKERYDKACMAYSSYSDANQHVILQSVRQKQVALENEMQLQYNAYMQAAAQLLSAEAKVQEETPAFTTLQSATVPVKKAGPSRSKICIVWVFLAFLAVTAWVFYKEDDYKMFFGQQ
jgi:uncharacterized protein involved in exopolysaccharide biosynthesis